MMNKQTSRHYSTGERIALFVCAVSIFLYFLNILVGKASVHWGWDVFLSWKCQ